MTTHAEITAKLLSEAAGFFRNLGEQNDSIKDQMAENANVFEQMADLLGQNPTGVIDGQTHAELAGKLLQDASVFFRSLAEQNEPIKEQMEQNAMVYEKMAVMVSQDPTGQVQES